MRKDLMGSVALPPGAAAESTNDHKPTIEIPDLRPVNDRAAVDVIKPINQTEATGAIGATGPPYDALTRADDVLVQSSVVRKKLGNVSDMTLWRRLKYDPQFPRPIVMAGRRYWWESTIDNYIDRQPTG